ncbi:MAG: TonB-dependent receptor plug domain-containing protein [Gammaproteobacteria bacterium]
MPTPRCRPTPSSIGLIGLAVLSSAAAQDQAAQPAPPLPRVEIAASPGAYDPRRDDTAAKIVIGSAELAKYGDTSVAEALKRVPGVTVSSTGRGAIVSMRGLGAGYTQILVNGDEAPPGFSIDALAPAQVERIEVIRSATAEFSTQSIAGTINIVLKRADRRPQRQAQLGYGGDASEQTGRGTFVVSGRDAGFSYGLSGYLRYSDVDRHPLITESDTAPSGATLAEHHIVSTETAEFAIATLIPKLTWTLAGGDTLSLDSVVGGSGYNATLQRPASGGPSASLPALDQRVRSRTSNARVDLVYNRKLGDGAKLELKIGAQGAHGSNDSDRDRNGAGARLVNAMAVDTRDRAANASVRYLRKLDDAHQLSMGAEATRAHRHERSQEVDHFPDGPSRRSDTRLHGRTVQAAAFIQDDWTVTPLWSVYLGVRAERIGTLARVPETTRSASTVWSPIGIAHGDVDAPCRHHARAQREPARARLVRPVEVRRQASAARDRRQSPSRRRARGPGIPEQ